MLHFFVDYLSMGIDATGNSGIEAFIYLIMFGAFILGLAYMVHYALKGFGALLGKDLRLERPIAAASPGPSYAPSTDYVAPAPMEMQPTPGGFDIFCHSCGSREAKYENGQLICAQCGRQL